MATLEAGGLVFTRSNEITMAREDLYISPEKVQVKYLYRNTSDKPISTIVAFPMPKIGGPIEIMSAVPDEQSDNFMDFSVVQEGAEIEPNLQQRVLVRGIDFTDDVEAQEIPLQPLLKKTTEALKTLEPDVIKDWLAKGLIADINYGTGGEAAPEYVPVWELESIYWWETTFPAGADVEVEHSYRPSVGGSAGLVDHQGVRDAVLAEALDYIHHALGRFDRMRARGHHFMCARLHAPGENRPAQVAIRDHADQLAILIHNADAALAAFGHGDDQLLDAGLCAGGHPAHRADCLRGERAHREHRRTPPGHRDGAAARRRELRRPQAERPDRNAGRARRGTTPGRAGQQRRPVEVHPVADGRGRPVAARCGPLRAFARTGSG
jgi:hypothetical protein